MAKITKIKKHTETKKITKKTSGPAIDVYSIDGKLIGSQPVEKDIFQTKINSTLEALAVRVYLANQRQGTSSTKTRGEVRGSTRKLYKQKGTGRARQGARRAPHRVGGGIVFGPKPRDYNLSLPKKAKRKALFSALSSKFKEGAIIAINNMSQMEPKTKDAAKMLTKLPVKGKKLLIIEKDAQNIVRATRNLEKVNCVWVNDIITYNILRNDSVIFSKKALSELKNIFLIKGNDAAG